MISFEACYATTIPQEELIRKVALAIDFFPNYAKKNTLSLVVPATII